MERSQWRFGLTCTDPKQGLWLTRKTIGMSIDFYEVAEHYALVVIDDYSIFPEVEIVHSTSAKAVLPKLDRIFALMVSLRLSSLIMLLPLMVKSSASLPIILVSSIVKVLLYGQKQMAKSNASWKHLARSSPQLLTGSNSCTSSYKTIEQLLIVLLVLLLPPPSLENQSGSSCLALLLLHAKQIWNKH